METFDRPKTSGFLVALAKMCLPALLLVRHGKTEINVVGDGLERFKGLKGKRAVICPNHPSWDDADMLFAFSNLAGENFNYMTAWEVLHQHFGFCTWLQHVGCFSVMRGLPDLASYRAMREILVKGKNKVVVFPEGEISHDSRNLLPLKAGMIQIAFSALQKMMKDGHSETIFLVPLALKYNFLEDPRPHLQSALNEMEQALEIEAPDSEALHLRINAVSQAVVKKLEREYGLEGGQDMFFDSRLDRLRSKILKHVASQLRVSLPEGKPHLELAHMLQGKLYAITYSSAPDPGAAGGKGDSQHTLSEDDDNQTTGPGKDRTRLRALARDLHRVIDFVSIYEGFAGQNSSVERLAEVVDLLEIEVLQRRGHRGGKRVDIHVGTPIDLSTFIYKYRSSKAEAEELVLSIYKEQMKAMIGVY